MSGQGRRLKAGEYRFDRAMTPLEVIDKIARGDVFVVTLTFPEGLTIAEMAKIFESHGLGPAAAFVDAAQDAALDSRARSRRRTIWKAICFRKPTRSRGNRRGASLCG